MKPQVKTLTTKIILSDAVDIKDFRTLMTKHNIRIDQEVRTEEGFAFHLSARSDDVDEDLTKYVEEVLVYTQMEWAFL